MRTGVLSDEHGRRKFQPLRQSTHDLHFTVPHLPAHGLDVRPTKRGRGTPGSTRSLTPTTSAHAYAQLLNPTNVGPFVEAFGNRIDSTTRYTPPVQFNSIVNDFERVHPAYAQINGMRPETSYFVREVREQTSWVVDLPSYFVKRVLYKNAHHQTRSKGSPSPSPLPTPDSALMSDTPLSKVFEGEYYKARHKRDGTRKNMIALYQEAMKHVLPPVVPTPPPAAAQGPTPPASPNVKIKIEKP